MAGTWKGPWYLCIPFASPTETLDATPQSVLKGPVLGHAFGLNHGYVYEEVASDSLAFVPDCWTVAKYMGGSFVIFPT